MGENSRRVTASMCALEKALKAHLASLEAAVQSDVDTRPTGGHKGQQHLSIRRAGTQSVITVNPVTKKATSTEEDQAVAKSLKPPGKVVVRLRVVFLKIGTIDTIHDRYSAEVLLQSKWHEPRLDSRKLESEDIDWNQFWCPRLSVENVIGEPKETIEYSIVYSTDWAADDGAGGPEGAGQRPRDRAIVCETRRITGAFFEFMELNKFPFDSQDLTVTVMSDVDESELELVEDKLIQSGVNLETFSCEQEWRLHPMVNVWHKTTTKKINRKVLHLSALCVAAKVSRRPQFFMWNIIVVMGVICSLAFVTFTVNLETPQSRLQLTFILLLTTVTFKFVVNKSLPRISYLTYMDKYILGTMFILCCVCVWHAIVGSVIYLNTKPANSTTTTATTTPIETTTTPLLVLSTTQSAEPPTDYNQSGSLKTEPFCPTGPGTANPTPPGEAAILADKIALGILGTVYVGFHIFFVLLVTCINKLADETRPNIEIEIDKDNPDMTSEAEGNFEVGSSKNAVVLASSSVHPQERNFELERK